MEQRNLAVDDSLSYVYGYCRVWSSYSLIQAVVSIKHKAELFWRLDESLHVKKKKSFWLNIPFNYSLCKLIVLELNSFALIPFYRHTDQKRNKFCQMFHRCFSTLELNATMTVCIVTGELPWCKMSSGKRKLEGNQCVNKAFFQLLLQEIGIRSSHIT